MRVAFPILVAAAVITLVACGGSDDTGTAEPAPLTLSQRLLTVEDAPGTKPDPVEKGGTTVDFGEFIQALGDLAVDPDTEEMTRVFKEAGFEGAGTETRFLR